ncbi:MAG: YhcH/YjgK/YiaL family protein [Rikenellaceae bacterium]
MKKTKCLILGLAIVLMCLAQNTSAQTKKQQQWFDSKQWLEGAEFTPAASVDVETFAKHYQAHPNRWKTIFEFLATQDLENLPLGLTEINENIKVNVQEYTTRSTAGRDMKAISYEKHNEYIDVQCVVSGAEIHGSTWLENATEVKPYNTEKDIAQYGADNVPYYIISEGMFTIFFPEQPHYTNIGYGERTDVRKVVFKVKYN